MKTYLKYGASAVALLAAFSLAQAQERPERGGTGQQVQGERASPSKHEGGAQQGKMENREHGGTATQEKQGSRETMQPGNRQGSSAQEHRTAKNMPEQEQREDKQQRENEPDQGGKLRQKEGNAGAAGKNEHLGRDEGGGAAKRTSIRVRRPPDN